MSHPKVLFEQIRLSLNEWDFHPRVKMNATPYRRSGLIGLPRGSVLSKHVPYSTTNGDTPAKRLPGFQNSFLSISSAPKVEFKLLIVGYICRIQRDFLYIAD